MLEEKDLQAIEQLMSQNLEKIKNKLDRMENRIDRLESNVKQLRNDLKQNRDLDESAYKYLEASINAVDKRLALYQEEQEIMRDKNIGSILKIWRDKLVSEERNHIQ